MFVMPLSRPVPRALVTPQFSRLVDRLFDEAIEPAPKLITPAVDVSESDTAYTVEFDVPGVTREQLKVSIEGRKVSIETTDASAVDARENAPKATDAEPVKPAAPRALYRERTVARYARTVSLPAEVDQATSQARLEHGVLTLVLAKKVANGAKFLSVN
jgi:HSP20 family protein